MSADPRALLRTTLERCERAIERGDGFKWRAVLLEELVKAARGVLDALPVAPQTGCINCGEANNGGYETEDVGSFCSSCWQLLQEYFTARDTPPADRWQPTQGVAVKSVIEETQVICSLCGGRGLEYDGMKTSGSSTCRNCSGAGYIMTTRTIRTVVDQPDPPPESSHG